MSLEVSSIEMWHVSEPTAIVLSRAWFQCKSLALILSDLGRLPLMILIW